VHHHEAEDELFLVVKGSLLIRLRDRDLRVEEGEFVIIPRGVEHLPVAEEEVHVLLLEPKSTLKPAMWRMKNRPGAGSNLRGLVNRP